MAAPSKAWDETAPAGSDNISAGDDEIRNGVKVAVRERMNNGGHIWETGSGTDATAGRHACGAEGTANELVVAYETDGTTDMITCNDSAATIDLNSNTLTNAPGVTTGDNPGHAHETTINIGLTPTAVGVIEGVMFVNRGNGVLTIVSAELSAFTAPSGGVCDCDILLHTVGVDADPSSSGSTIFVTNSPPSIADGKFHSGVVTLGGSDDVTVAVGEALTFEILAASLNSASDLVMTLEVSRA